MRGLNRGQHQTYISGARILYTLCYTITDLFDHPLLTDVKLPELSTKSKASFRRILICSRASFPSYRVYESGCTARYVYCFGSAR